MPPSTFISYAHEDVAAAAWLAAELEAIGIKVFLDSDRLATGDRLPTALEQAVVEADVFVLLATADGLASEWTRREFLWATGAGRRVCPIYPAGIAPATSWPELTDLLGVDASKSLAAVIDGAIRAFPGCSGAVTRLDEELERRDIDLPLCAELLRGISAAVQRHVPRKTWLAEFSLENCFLWSARSGAPPLADTHIFVAPDAFAAIASTPRHKNELPRVAGGARVSALRASLTRIAKRLLHAATHSDLLESESPSQAFARLNERVATLDHKRLFNYLSLVHDLMQGEVAVALPALLEHVQQQCVYAESPSPAHRAEFRAVFSGAAMKDDQSISVIVISSAPNRSIYACLESIYAQTRRPDEVIVVEDSADDDSQDVISRFAVDHHVCLPTARSGLARRAKCRHVGTAMARGNVLLYVDGDTVLGPAVVEAIVAWWNERDASEGCLSLLIPDVELPPPEDDGFIAYSWVIERMGGSADPLPALHAFSGAGIIRSWHDSRALSGAGLTDSVSWRNVRSRCWSVVRNDVTDVGNWDQGYEGWGTEETDLAYRLHLDRGMRVRVLSEKGGYAVHIAHAFDADTRADEHARNESRLISKFPALAAERMVLAHRLGIAHRVNAYLGGPIVSPSELASFEVGHYESVVSAAVDIPRPHPSADPERAVRLNLQYQRDLQAWHALPRWKRLFMKKPDAPTGI